MADNLQKQTFEDEDFLKLLEESYSKKEIKEGEIVKGRVIYVGKDHVVVDIGYKSEGQIPLAEFNDATGVPRVKVGEEISVLLESRENDAGLCVLSKEKADKLKIWDEISAACEKDELVEGTIVARVKGGLSVDIGVKAFLPGSQVDLRPIRNLDRLLHQRFKFKVIKFNKKRGNIVLSRRVLLEKERDELKKKTLERLKENMILDGIVKNITEYGAFVDLGGLDGLLHITDMSWGRVNHPNELFEVSDEVRVKVLKFNPDTERVSLGIKQISEDPWMHAEEAYPVQTRVKGRVVSLTDYGAFIELEQGIEGLIHISEMSWTRRVKHPSKVVAIGDSVEAVVLDIDSKNKRISLGMKQIEPNPWQQLREKYPVGSRISGKIRNITDFGVFIGVEDGIDGLVHISDISWTIRVKHPNELFSKGDEIETVVLNIDVENERFSLGIKQLIDDPWDRITREYPTGRILAVKVLKISESGIFVELEKGIEALIPTNELPADAQEDPKKIAKEGEPITAEITQLDTHERRVIMSVRSLTRSEAKADYAAYVGKTAKEEGASTKLGSLLKERGLDNMPDKKE
jgi:small subunit ribosomal protein S1